MPWEPDYVTVDDLADYLKITDDDDDTELARAVTSASRAIDKCTKRQFGKVDAPEARYYTPRWSRSRGVWRVDVDDLMDDAGLLVEWDSAGDGSFATEITRVRPSPFNAVAEQRPWTLLELLDAPMVSTFGRPGSVRATAPWGWSAVPVAVEEAALLQGSRFHKRKDAPFGIAGTPTQGSEMRLLARADPDVVVAVASYARKRVAR